MIRRTFASRRHPFGLLALALLAALATPLPADASTSDAAGDVPAAYVPRGPRYEEWRRTSRYLAMRDGVRIAVDVWLPEGLAEDARIPAILHQTRYWRAADLRPPARWLAEEPDALARAFLRRGYAWVAADARGSGASFGTRPFPWSPAETRDGAGIAGWIARQPWSSGRVGSFGTSYDGTAAELLATTGHPAVGAAAPRFSLFDVFADIAFPGGLHLRWFTETWGITNAALDANRLPEFLAERAGWRAWFVRGVRPVDGPEGDELLVAALRDHAANWDVHASALEIDFRDDPDASGHTVEAFSPYAFADRLEAADVPVYSWSGWFDGGYAHAAIKRHLTLDDPRNRLILGPWDHGGLHQVRGGRSEPSDFDHAAELLRFFDHHLKGIDTGIADGPAVHYYTLVEGRWKAAAAWPPPAERTPFHLGPEGRLSREAPGGDAEAVDVHRVDRTHGTGPRSRWNSLMGLPVHYPDRAEADRSLLVYQTPPLARDVEVTGHPTMILYVASDARDGAFFAYLEDVAPDGSVTYVSEGLLRALHRRLADGEPPHALAPGVPHRSFARADAAPLVPGEPAELVFDLLPTSYLFREGHRIRLALAGADADHFEPVPAEGAPTWRVHRSAARPSRLVLPIVP